jgi:DNA-binding response OmpR family regulator
LDASRAAPTVAESTLRGNDAQVHGSLARVEALLMSPDPRTRELMALTIRSIERRLGEDLRFRAAANGELALRAALRDRPEIVVADELASRMGAFALARSLRDAAEPYTGVIVVLLERTHDAWLASWSGADAWYVKPADPFAVADRLWELLGERGLVRELEEERA